MVRPPIITPSAIWAISAMGTTGQRLHGHAAVRASRARPPNCSCILSGLASMYLMTTATACRAVTPSGKHTIDEPAHPTPATNPTQIPPPHALYIGHVHAVAINVTLASWQDLICRVLLCARWHRQHKQDRNSKHHHPPAQGRKVERPHISANSRSTYSYANRGSTPRPRRARRCFR